MMNVIRENKGLMLLLVASVLAIIVGLWFVQASNKKQAQQEQQLSRLNAIAAQANAELQQSVVHADVPIDDIIPQQSVEKVAAMKGKEPELGSEDWCEWMMVKDSEKWSEAEQLLFAQKCI